MHRRDEFVEAALLWEGVPWREVGTRRDGVNCIGLFIGVARELGGLDAMVERLAPYANFARPPIRGDMLRGMREHLEAIPVRDAAPGDLLVFRLSGEPQHAALLTGPNTILHSDHRTDPKRVRGHPIPPEWTPTMAFRIRELG